MKNIFFLIIIVLGFINISYAQKDTAYINFNGMKVSIGKYFTIHTTRSSPYKGKVVGINNDVILIYNNFDLDEVKINDITFVEKYDPKTLSTHSSDEIYDTSLVKAQKTYYSFGLTLRNTVKQEVKYTKPVPQSGTYGIKANISHFYMNGFGITGSAEWYRIRSYQPVDKNYLPFSGTSVFRVAAGPCGGNYSALNTYNYEFRLMTGVSIATYTYQDYFYDNKHTLFIWDVYLGMNNNIKVSSKTRAFIEPGYIIEIFDRPSVWTITGGIITYF